MKRILKALSLILLALIVLIVVGAAWYFNQRLPKRSGELPLSGLSAAVTVDYDERGVPHIRANNEADMYRALGFVHAQDRLFQMEMMRRLARGELAEILGPKLLDTDRLFRTLSIREKADAAAAKLDPNSPTQKAMSAYLDGINQFQATRPLPVEFALLGIPKRPFTVADSISVSGYLAYSFAQAFRTDPVLTYIRDVLGPNYIKAFDVDWHPEGVIKGIPGAYVQAQKQAANKSGLGLAQQEWDTLGKLARLSHEALETLGLPQFEGSNAWLIAGSRSASGKPILAGDPHIAFAEPAVWYEAQLSAPGFELYGHHLVLNSSALLGFNSKFGWSLTMFQNDDIDLVAEELNPANPNQVKHRGQWVDLQSREETINVKGAAPVKFTVRRSPHGPIINDVWATAGGPAPGANKKPISMWWAFLETENPVLDAFYELNRADTLAKARAACSKIHAPGLNVLYANTAGDIGWWASAKLPLRPEGINPNFILNGATGEAEKSGFRAFENNPHEENPARGYIVSANHQPMSVDGKPVWGYYNLWERAQRLDELLRDNQVKWDIEKNKALQLDARTGYPARLLQPLLPVLREVVTDPGEKALLEQLAAWDGSHVEDSIAPTLFNQFVYQLAEVTMADKMDDALFKGLLKTRALDLALPRIAVDADSPWWDNRKTPQVESRKDTMKKVWADMLAHLKATFGADSKGWLWGKAHTLTHGHPLAKQPPLDKLFNVGPLNAPGGREVLNNISGSIGPGPWAVTYGPSTRRLIDFADPTHSLGINPVGQSGIVFDKHYKDQAPLFVKGVYVPHHYTAEDVAAHTRGTLKLTP